MFARCFRLRAGFLRFTLTLGAAALLAAVVPGTARAQVRVTEIQKLLAGSPRRGTSYGGAIAVEGDIAVIGEPFANGRGIVHLLRRSAGVWTSRITLAPLNQEEGFGLSVALSNGVLAVGAPFAVSGGAVYVYRVPAVTGAPALIAQLTGVLGFGSAVDVSRTGSIAVGSTASSSDPDAVHMYEVSGSSVVPDVVLVGGDTDPSDSFGAAVSFDASGRRLWVGAPEDDDPARGADAGSVYLFERPPARRPRWAERNKLVASDASTSARFGSALDAFSTQSFPFQLIVGAPGAAGSAGAAYVFEGTTQRAKLVPSAPAAGDRFGVSVAADGYRVAIGADSHDQGGANAGAAYVFERRGTTWAPKRKLVARDGAAGNRFGAGLALQSDALFVGARVGDSPGLTDTGAAYVFRVEPDFDEDGVVDASDRCPLDARNDLDRDGICGDVQIYYSPTTDTFISGVGIARPEDVVRYDERTGTHSLYFDGSDVGLSGLNVDGLNLASVAPEVGGFFLSLDRDFDLPPLGPVLVHQALVFLATSVGSTTAGSFSYAPILHAEPGSADVEGLGLSPSPNENPLHQGGLTGIFLSFSTATTLGGKTFENEDIALKQELGPNQYSLYFDGSDVGLAGYAIDAFHVLEDGTILLSFTTSPTLPGLPLGTTHNVVRFTPTSLGENTAGTFSPYLRSGQNGIPTLLNIDALTVGSSVAAP